MSVYTDIWNDLEFSPRYSSSGNADIQRNRLNFKAKAVFQKRGLCTRAAPRGAQSLLRPALPHTTECPGPRSPLQGGQGPAGSRGRGAERSGAGGRQQPWQRRLRGAQRPWPSRGRAAAPRRQRAAGAAARRTRGAAGPGEPGGAGKGRGELRGSGGPLPAACRG